MRKETVRGEKSDTLVLLPLSYIAGPVAYLTWSPPFAVADESVFGLSLFLGSAANVAWRTVVLFGFNVACFGLLAVAIGLPTSDGFVWLTLVIGAALMLVPIVGSVAVGQWVRRRRGVKMA